MTCGPAIDACDRRDVADEIEIELVVERRIDRVRSIPHRLKRVAVRGRSHDRLGGDIAGAPGRFSMMNGLAKPLRQPLHQSGAR